MDLNKFYIKLAMRPAFFQVFLLYQIKYHCYFGNPANADQSIKKHEEDSILDQISARRNEQEEPGNVEHVVMAIKIDEFPRKYQNTTRIKR